MKSILIVTEAFTVGGLETHIQGEIRALAQLGYQVHLAVGSSFSDSLVPKEVTSITTGLNFSPSASVAETIGSIDQIRQLIKSQCVDVVHAHPFTTLIPAFIAAELENVKFALTLHGPGVFGNHYGPIFEMLLRAFVLPFSSAVFSVSKELATLASLHTPAESLKILPNGVNFDTASDIILRSRDPRWLVISRIDNAKSNGILDFVLKAHSANLPGVVIAGDGPAKDSLIERISELGLSKFVTFLGQQLDIYLLIEGYSGVAGMGRVALEGVACRRPVCLIGYEGVKGILTSHNASRAGDANFSGRNLSTVEAADILAELEVLSDIEIDSLHRQLRREFSEDTIWKSFITHIDARPRLTSSALGRALESLIGRSDANQTPFLDSPIVINCLQEVALSFRFFEPRLVAQVEHCRNSLPPTFSTNPPPRETECSAFIHEEVVEERELPRAHLLEEIQSLTASNDLLKSHLRLSEESRHEEAETHRQQMDELASKMLRVSDWAVSIDQRPFAHGFRKACRIAAKKVFHALPVSLSFKSRLKGRLRRLVKSYSGRAVSAADKDPHSITSLGRISEGIYPERDIFIFAVIDWQFRIQRPQHLARALANAGRRVFYFSNHFIDTANPGYDIERLDSSLELYQIKLYVEGAPAIYFAPPSQQVVNTIRAGIAQVIRDFSSLATASVVQHAFWYPAIEALPNSLRVYDCMDHHEGFGNVPEKLIEIEKRMLEKADLVVVTSSWLYTLASRYNPHVELVRNAGEYEHFAPVPDEIYVDPKGRKIIGYFGAIAEWFDLDLIRLVANDHPQALVLLVGNDTINARQTLRHLSNVEFIGEVSYSRLPYFLHAFDICLLPFQVIPLTLATNPVKVYEYLAAGKPVVCVDLPEVAQFRDHVYCATSQGAFRQSVTTALSTSEPDEVKEARRTFASNQTWNHRAATLNRALEGVSLPKVSVIVLTYNNIELTKACLDSIAKYTDYPNVEIIVVDNASTDESPEFLRTFASAHPNFQVIFNDKNLGFAAGNNVGLKAATGDYLVMLNNDTVVTPGWLLTMVRHFQADQSIGLVGPVTNNIGNEAKVELEYDGPSNMLPSAVLHTTAHMGKQLPLRTAAFFCVMMPRNVYEQVGLLDENFGRGFFEDDDYCRRVEQLGFRIVCAEDVFIHHHLSASFNKLGSTERQAIFSKNKLYYESKWGEWKPHSYR